MPTMPRLADINCTKTTFQPGDRVLVRCYHRLEPSARKKLEKDIQRWAGVDVRVLVYCPMDMEIVIDRR